ncbi:hypothetical protein K7711_00550 [Nocardia sp. CA2R105]|uniref:DUF6153 family protein n=1 Tax=Nocardia coffeae TaxID=2873381 RepID=UPI001CA64E3A|nr:DUF6153 family protein [Nocardia coffeae]MBY8854959.1 hypothetical protein [Nocardia coffeae]
MSRRPEHLATGYVRVAGLLTLLLGILVMHVFIASHASSRSAEHSATQAVPDHTMSLAAGHNAVPAAAHDDATAMTARTARHYPASDHPISLAADQHAMPMAGDTSMTAPSAPTAQHHPAAMTALTSMMMPGDGMDPGCADCCVLPGGVHACVFILTALVLLLGLALLGRVGDDADASARTVRGWAARRARPPPWTTLSLAELSILRI